MTHLLFRHFSRCLLSPHPTVADSQTRSLRQAAQILPRTRFKDTEQWSNRREFSFCPLGLS